MKLIGIVGNNANFSYNRILLNYMAKHFADQVEIEAREIRDLPMFCESNEGPVPESVMDLANAIDGADGVIIATPEYDHSIPAALKSCIEWLSYAAHPFVDKPVMIIGASLGQQGTSWAQTQLREILNSPGVNARVLSGNQFMLSFAKQQLNEAGNLTNEKTIHFLDQCFASFEQFVQVNNSMKVAE
ncbi:putative fumarate reductase [Secundilactobacillus oryzae JCM 18671]|uniref:Putative fumarate reductase n=1 Tax=Secundilactobacillus oryzae JCM 18671 TaxID=1291743 RepID=A0A081BKY1_9LACO|nr:NADPH-dependent FMN reductase [Secundilactobacillus oryzae]GAK48699.1 putative fumarate reductase [Secundilactobacillus oryzae JCM 18671]